MTAAVLVGQQTPRLQLVPPCASNAADDAVELYESCGQRLDDWQDLCLRIGCGETRLGAWASFENGIVVSRQNGKGAVIEALCLASLFIWGNKVTIYSAHRGDTVQATFRRIRALIEDHPDLTRRCKPINPSDDVIELITGGRLEFRTRTRSGGRGLTGDLVILDEALELNPEQIAALVPVLLARPHAQLWYFSTVPATGDQHLCLVRKRVLAGAERIGWADWGVDSGAALDDPAALAAANPALGIRITLERLHDLRGILGDEKFKTECMGIWPSLTAGAVLDPKAWANMCDPESKRSGDLALAIDVTPLRDHGTIGLFGYRDDGLEHVQLVDSRPGVDWIPGRAAELAAILDPIGWAVDEKNGAYAMREQLAAVGIVEPEDPLVPGRGNLLVVDARGAADAVAGFIDAFRRSAMRHPGQPPLDDAVKNAKARPIGDAGQIAWGRRASEVNIGGLITVTNARHLWMTWHDLVTTEYDVLRSIPLAEGQCPDCEAWAPEGAFVEHYDDCATRAEAVMVQ